MQIEVKTITPNYAAELLAMNTKNRPLDRRRAARLASSIKRGEWKMNGDAIRISDTGVVLDGQHRLSAILLSGQTVQSVVINGLPDDVFDTIDVDGRPRTAADVLSIRGEKHYSTLAAIAKALHTFYESGSPFNGNPDNKPTVKQIDEMVDGNPDMRDAAAYVANSVWMKKFIEPTVAGFCYLIFHRRDAAACKNFFDKLCTGAGLEPGSPILALRERLVSDSTEKGKINKTYKTALIFKAFRHYRDGASIKFLRVRTEGDAAEKDLFRL